MLVHGLNAISWKVNGRGLIKARGKFLAQFLRTSGSVTSEPFTLKVLVFFFVLFFLFFIIIFYTDNLSYLEHALEKICRPDLVTQILEYKQSLPTKDDQNKEISGPARKYKGRFDYRFKKACVFREV